MATNVTGVRLSGARAQARRKHKVDKTTQATRFASLVILTILAILMVFPLVWMVLTSLRPNNTVFGGPFIPKHFTFAAYTQAWDSLSFGGHFLNSVYITVTTVIGTVALATIAGYAFSKVQFRFKNIIYFALLSTMMMPASALLIPLYLQLKDLGFLGKQGGLIVLYIATQIPFAMFLMRAFFDTLPGALIEAARIDGASEFGIFWRVMLPLARAGIATVMIFIFLSTWNEFLYARTVLTTASASKLPLQPVIFGLLGVTNAQWPVITAAMTMSILPILIVYIRLQKQFVAGMTLGAVK